MKIHFKTGNNRFLCGKRMAWNSLTTEYKKEITCSTCAEMIKFDNGSTWKLSGNYDKNGDIRKNKNHFKMGK